MNPVKFPVGNRPTPRERGRAERWRELCAADVWAEMMSSSHVDVAFPAAECFRRRTQHWGGGTKIKLTVS